MVYIYSILESVGERAVVREDNKRRGPQSMINSTNVTNKKREKQYNSVNNSHDNYSKNKNIKYHNYTTNKIVDHQ